MLTEITEETIIQERAEMIIMHDYCIEAYALKWFASLEPDEMLAQITYMYKDRMKQSQQEYEAVTG